MTKTNVSKLNKKGMLVAAVVLLLAAALFVGAGAGNVPEGSVAQIGEQGYTTLQAAFDAAGNDVTVQLIANITYDNCSTAPLVVLPGETERNFTLDLNGHTITAKLINNKNICVLEIGKNTASHEVNLTIKDSQASNLADPATGKGAIIAKPSDASDSWTVSVSTITLHEHGNLTIESGKIITEGRDGTPNADNPYAIDIILNSGNSDAILTVNGGYIESKSDTGIAIRANCNNSTNYARVTVNGGKIVGDGRGIWMQWSNDSNNSWGEFTINGGKITADRALELGDFGKTLSATKGFTVKIADSDALVCNNIGNRPTHPDFGKLTASTSTVEYYRADVNPNGAFDHVEVIFPVAQIGDKKYYTLAEAVTAVQAGDTPTTITMIADHTIMGNAGVTIPKEKKIVLDLNGHTVQNVVGEEKASQIIDNQGTLTIKDSTDKKKDGTGKGKLMNAVEEDIQPGEWDQWNYATNVILNHGTLVVESGLLAQTAGGDICYAIDAQTNGTSYTVSTTIKGGKMTSVYTAVRTFCNSTTHANDMIVEGGTIISQNESGLMIQSANKDANKASLTIRGGSFSGTYTPLRVYADEGGDTSNMSVAISGGEFTTKNVIFEKVAPQTLSISGGQFEGITVPAGKEKFISGGTFSTDVTPYVVSGKGCFKEGDLWVVGPGCIVSFDANGGTGSMVPQSARQGGSLVLNPNQFTNSTPDVEFIGWAETNATGAAVKYVDCGTITKVENDMTLYAVWKTPVKPSLPEDTTVTPPAEEGGVTIITAPPANLTVTPATATEPPVAVIESGTAKYTMTYAAEEFDASTYGTVKGNIVSIVVDPKLDATKLGPTQDTSEENDKVTLKITMDPEHPEAINDCIPQLSIAVNETLVKKLEQQINPAENMYFAIGAMIEGKPQGEKTAAEMNAMIKQIKMEMKVNANWVNTKGKANIKVYHIPGEGTAKPVSFTFGSQEEDYYPVIITSEEGFSAYAVTYVEAMPSSSSSSTPQGSSVWLTEPAAQPTATPTPTPTPSGEPTVVPIETPTPAAATPAPFIGILAGLGAAAAVFGLRRK